MVQTELTLINNIIPGKLETLKQVLAVIGDPNRPSLIAPIGTIHFARWVIIDNGTRLLFTSNFDGSWEDYLDDFIEKLSEGLDRIWCNCEGYPEGGAKEEAKFKQWVRDHQTKAELFYSAYPEHTVQDVLKALRVRTKFEELLDELQ